MGIIGRAWKSVSWLATGYVVYKKLEALSQAKDEFYTELPDNLKPQWDAIFGKPGPVSVVTPKVNPVTPIVRNTSDIDKIEAGV